MKQLRVQPGFRAAMRDNGVLELTVYEEIGANWFSEGVTAKSVKQQIDAAGAFNRVLVRINSPGGDAFEGVAIQNLLRAQGKPIDVVIDGLAASAASIIAMAGDTITMGANAMMMIHDAWSMCVGNDEDMRKMADTLEKVSESIAQTYVQRTGQSMDAVKAMMDAETWLSAEECVANGFATGIAGEEDEDAMQLAASFRSLARLKNVPEKLLPRAEAKTKKVDGEDLTWSDFIIASDHEDPSTWHLPWKFSSLEKTKAHLRDALARFNQVQGLSEDEKHAAWTKLVRLCKEYGIQVSQNKEDAGIQNAAMECDCECAACQMQDHENCMMADGCPMPDPDDPDADPDPSEPTEARASNLSHYEARLKLLRAA